MFDFRKCDFTDYDPDSVDIEGFLNDSTQYYLKESHNRWNGAGTEYTGTPLQIVEQYIKAKGLEIKYTPLDDGDGYFVDLAAPQKGEGYSGCWTEKNDGSDKEAIHYLYTKIFCYFYLEAIHFGLYILLCELADADIFKMDYNELLKKITAYDVKKDSLDLDDEVEIRKWYCEKRHGDFEDGEEVSIRGFERRQHL